MQQNTEKQQKFFVMLRSLFGNKPLKVNACLKFPLPLSYSRYLPNSEELFLLIFTGLSPAYLKSHGNSKHFNWLVKSPESRDIPLPSKANRRLFCSSVIFQALCSALCSALLPSHIFPAYNTAAFHSSENTQETTWKILFIPFLLWQFSKPLRFGAFYWEPFTTAAFLDKRNAFIKDVQGLHLLFCKTCTLYWYLQFKSSINDSTTTNF